MYWIAYTFLLATQLACVSAKPSVLFPLYIYPTPGAWQPLYWALGNNTKVTFKIIINPNSGPVKAGFPAGDLSNYVAAMTTLNQYPNAKTYGYVDTNWPKRPDDDIVRDIDSWKYGPSALIPTGGIFFDDVITNEANAIWSFNNAQSYARLDNFTDIIANPGTTPTFPDPRYPGTTTPSGIYSMANSTLVYENYYGTPYGPSVASNVAAYITSNNQGTPWNKLTAMVYGLPQSAASNNVTGGCAKTNSFLCTFTNSFTNVVGSLYLSDLPLINGGGNYTAFPNNFRAWVSILNGSA
ncbi:hypothetical protein PVAG01_01352 [Phlyctema vagabunda]|uniref:Uncharacterized protein n=1 Tax=Phlyctema vagabunda TaxID=108571 RepID=A0ABR4PWV3_9HELO